MSAPGLKGGFVGQWLVPDDGSGAADQGSGAEPGGRWERLFSDLEAATEAAAGAELAGEVADRTRREFARVRLVDRLRATIGHPVTIAVVAFGPVVGAVRDVGPDWVLLAERGVREVVVRLAAVTGVSGLGLTTAEPGSEGAVAAKLDLRYLMRRLTRDRAVLAVGLADGTTVYGTCDRVGADFLDLAEHPPAEARRASAVRRVRAVPLGAVVVIRSG